MARALLFCLTLFALLSARPSAAESIVIGKPCSNLGVSTLSSDQKDVAICLRDDDGDLHWKASTRGGSGLPAGTIAFFALGACPSGWLLANGAGGTVDLRGEFIRVADNGRGIDAGRTAKTAQADTIRNITGSMSNIIAAGRNGYNFSSSGALYGQGLTPEGADPSYHGPDYYQLLFDASRVVPTAAENRPRNIALIACQKQ